jgi:hypothetical protein
MTYLPQYPYIFTELLKKTMKNLIQDILSQPRCEFSTSQIYMSTTLTLNQCAGEILFLKKACNTTDIILSVVSD